MKTKTIALKTFKGIGKNGRPLSFAKGDILNPNRIENLLPRHMGYVKQEVVTPAPKLKMSRGEKMLLADLYNDLADPINQSDNRDMIISEYLKIYPNRPEATLIYYICQCKHIDTYYDSLGFTSVDKNIIIYLNGIDSDRYMSLEDYEFVKSFT